jgi:molybdenum cofactor biosynthesis protein B
MTSSESTADHRRTARTLSATCAIITCSDSRTEETDSSGQLIKSELLAAGHEILHYQIVPDDVEIVRSLIQRRVSESVDVILLNGGTGIARRDVTFDVVELLLEKTLPGFGEIFRMLSYDEVGAASMLSRATAGIIGGTIVFSMPGSTNAVQLAMQKLIIPELKHLVWELTR